MLSLRLKRIGKKHQAAFRLVVGERRSKLKGDYTEDLGWYNPRLKKPEFKVERVKYWLSVGAQPSDTVHNLLIASGLMTGSKIAVHKKAKKTAETKDIKKQTPAGAEEKPATAPAAESAKAEVVKEPAKAA